MIVIKDSMVLIHLAKITILENACDFFKNILIPEKVFEETVLKGKERSFDDAMLIESIIKKGKIRVMKIRKKELIKKINDFNVFGGEAEAVALYKQEKANYIATDDDSVRNKKEILEIRVIGTPSIILMLLNNKKIGTEKAIQSISKLRKIGWFSNEVMDKMLMEIEKNE